MRNAAVIRQWKILKRIEAGRYTTSQDLADEHGVTERVAIVKHDDFQTALRAFKARGYRVAVDDMGAGYSSFQALASIEPDFLKFDVSLVRDIDRSSIKRSLLESLRHLAEKIHPRVIAEGVERPEEMQTLLELGIELGQGYHFHREEPLPVVVKEPLPVVEKEPLG